MTSVLSLAEQVPERLRAAREAPDHRSSISLHDGESCVLRQTVTALLAGQVMDWEHPPDEAWLLVLSGIVHMVDATGTTDLTAYTLMRSPQHAHHIQAVSDSVLLISVAKGERPVFHDVVDRVLPVNPQRVTRTPEGQAPLTPPVDKGAAPYSRARSHG